VKQRKALLASFLCAYITYTSTAYRNWQQLRQIATSYTRNEKAYNIIAYKKVL